MALFQQSGPKLDPVAHAVCGAYLIVAFSDGQYEKSEQIRIAALSGRDVSAGIDKASVEQALPILVKAFETNYEAAAATALDAIKTARAYAFAKQAVIHAARTALLADQVISQQEEQAMERIAQALGLEKGSL